MAEKKEVELTEAEEKAQAIKKAEDKIVIGKGTLGSVKGKRLIAKGNGYEVVFND